jgi:hypothetical protein
MDVLAGGHYCCRTRLRDVRGCPDPARLFIDELAKVSYIEDTTSIVEAGISQVFS